MSEPSDAYDVLAACVREGLADGCHYACGCDDPGNPSKCIHVERFAALSELVGQARRAAWLEDELDECDKRADRAEAAGVGQEPNDQRDSA